MNENFPKITAFPALAELASEFKDARVYLVGGAVRDILLGKPVTDVDLVVRNVAGDQLEDFLATRGRVVFAGKTFGVWKFHEVGKPKNEVYDIALPRTEFSLHKQGQYRDFNVQTNPKLPIADDLARRDFTVNAMAYDLVAEKLIDKHGGQADLAAKIIRTVGQPNERFQEDFSRLLRALRFSLQLGFTIEPNTRHAISAMMSNLNNVIAGRRVLPYEVMAEELLKSLKIDAVKTLDLWDEVGAINEIMPELLKMKACPQPQNWHTEGDVWDHTRLALKKLSSPEFKKEFPAIGGSAFGGGNSSVDIETILAVLFHDAGKPYTIRTPEKDGIDRIRYDEHDVVGADIAKKVLTRLKVAAPPEINVKPSRVVWAVRYHMLAVHGNPADMRPTTIEKYFFSRTNPSQTLLKLMLVDGLATVNQEGNGMSDRFVLIKNRMQEIKTRTNSHGLSLVKALINGEDIMAKLGIKAGVRVGEILELVRQQQLSGEIKSRAKALEYLDTLK